MPNPILDLMMNQKLTPQQLAMNMLQQRARNNPILQNVLNMTNSNDFKGIENVARNLCRSKGIDADKAINDLMKH